MNVCKSVSNTFGGMDERKITQPTHCRNVRPEGFSPVVLLEVNSAVTQAGMSENTPRGEEIEQFGPLYIELFSVLNFCHLNAKMFTCKKGLTD